MCLLNGIGLLWLRTVIPVPKDWLILNPWINVYFHSRVGSFRSFFKPVGRLDWSTKFVNQIVGFPESPEGNCSFNIFDLDWTCSRSLFIILFVLLRTYYNIPMYLLCCPSSFSFPLFQFKPKKIDMGKIKFIESCKVVRLVHLTLTSWNNLFILMLKRPILLSWIVFVLKFSSNKSGDCKHYVSQINTLRLQPQMLYHFPICYFKASLLVLTHLSRVCKISSSSIQCVISYDICLLMVAWKLILYSRAENIQFVIFEICFFFYKTCLKCRKVHRIRDENKKITKNQSQFKTGK